MNKSQLVELRKLIRTDFENLHNRLREEDYDRYHALRKEREKLIDAAKAQMMTTFLDRTTKFVAALRKTVDSTPGVRIDAWGWPGLTDEQRAKALLERMVVEDRKVLDDLSNEVNKIHRELDRAESDIIRQVNVAYLTGVDIQDFLDTIPTWESIVERLK
jgi:hypothetical protein